jgi:RNA polymerase sigma factor for flagellar operon FliA
VPADTSEVLSRFESELPLADWTAHQMREQLSKQLPLEELESFAREGLLEAARRYDPARGASFRTFALYRIRGAVLDGLRAHTGLPRRAYERVRAMGAGNDVSEGFAEDLAAELAAGIDAERADERLASRLAAVATAMAMGCTAPGAVGERGELVAADPGMPADRCLEREELRALVRREVDRLPEAESTLVRRYFLGEEKLEPIARDMGLSKSWGSRILARGVEMLAKRLAAREP